MTNGRFQVSEFHRPFSGDESEEMTVASRPLADLHAFEKQTLELRGGGVGRELVSPPPLAIFFDEKVHVFATHADWSSM